MDLGLKDTVAIVGGASSEADPDAAVARDAETIPAGIDGGLARGLLS